MFTDFLPLKGFEKVRMGLGRECERALLYTASLQKTLVPGSGQMLLFGHLTHALPCKNAA